MYDEKNIPETATIQDPATPDPTIFKDEAPAVQAPAPVQEAPAIIQDAAVAPAPVKTDTAPEAPADPETYVRFSKPYSFEGSVYAGIDLGGIENITAKDMIEAEKYLAKNGIISPIPEMTMEYIGFIGNRATGQPIEFFKGLPPKDAIKVKNKVSGFFYGED